MPHVFGCLDEDLIARATTLIVSPGMSLSEPVIAAAIARGCKVIGDIDLFIAHANAPVIAITGSNAKSTVTTLVGDMAKACDYDVGVGGNIGTAALSLLAEEKSLYVLELSSFQLERCEPLNAEVATVLNLSPDHMDRYESMQEYHQAKHKIFRGAKNIVINRDDVLTQPLVPESIPVASFGVEKKDVSPSPRFFSVITEGDKRYLTQGMEKILPVSELKIRGDHNISNALAALAIGYQAGFSLEGMLKALTQFTGLEHRCEWVTTVDHVEYYNDSKGTNVGATKAAIQGLASDIKGELILIAGGVGKGADFSDLSPVVNAHVSTAIVFGESQKDLQQTLKHSTAVQCVDSMSDAVALASRTAKPGDLVLLSPACASFDMFKNYEHRGVVFKKMVKQLDEHLHTQG